MTNRLELNWKLDGFVDEQRYYCSETPIDVNNLPTPKTVLAGDVRSYVDTVIETGKTYYVCVGSVKNSVEKLSGVRVVTSINAFPYFRLHIASNNGDASFTAIQEIELAENIGGQDLTTPSTGISVNSFFTGFGANKVIDGNIIDPLSCWISASASNPPYYFTFQLPEPKKIQELTIYPQTTPEDPSIGITRAPREFALQGSSDGVSWITLRSFSNISDWSIGNGKKFKITD